MKRIHLTLVLCLVLSILIFGCTQKNGIVKSDCCDQCLKAHESDMRGFDTSSEKCSFYKDVPVYEQGKPTKDKVISEECKSFFDSNKMTVSACRS